MSTTLPPRSRPLRPRRAVPAPRPAPPAPSNPTSPRPRRLLRKLIPRLAGLCLVGGALAQEFAPVYDFPHPKPFSGSHFYDPYAGVDGRWLAGNFHAHARAWYGLTNGNQSAAGVRERYRAMGYSVVTVSDYQHVAAGRPGDPTYIPVYEHGYNVAKTHQLAIGARHVVWDDFVLWQSIHHKEFVLKKLKRASELVAIAHPELRAGYSLDDFRYLTSYDLLEIRSHFGTAVPDWDVALSNGHPVWAIGDDDSHDADDPGQTGGTWTMIASDSRDRESVIDALRAGRDYVVKGRRGQSDVTLRGLEMRGDTMTVRCSAPVSSIEFVGQDGRHLASALNTADASYVMKPGDSYVRTVITTAATKMYLNPVLRYDGAQLPHPAATLDVKGTWLVRLSMLITLIMATMLVSIGTPRAVGAQAESSDPPSLPFGVGERLDYQVRFGPIPVGSGSMSVTGIDTLDGRPLMHLAFAVKGGTLFFRVNDLMESWFDPSTLSAARFTQNLNEGSRHYRRRYDFDGATRTVHERGKAPAPSVEFPLDDASFVYFIRTQPLVVGRTYTYDRYFRRDANPVTIHVLRRERITVPAGTFDAIVVQPVIRTKGLFGQGGHAMIWLSDDSSRMVLQLRSSLPFGSLDLYLKSYARGAVTAQRWPAHRAAEAR